VAQVKRGPTGPPEARTIVVSNLSLEMEVYGAQEGLLRKLR
jgi:hypothetical protein